MRILTVFTALFLALFAPLAADAGDHGRGHGHGHGHGWRHGHHDNGHHYGWDHHRHDDDWRRYSSRDRVNISVFAPFGGGYYEPSYHYRRPPLVNTRNVVWVNPQPSHSYTLLTSVVQDSPAAYCREYQANATIGRHVRQTYGTACMQPDGSWEIVN